MLPWVSKSLILIELLKSSTEFFVVQSWMQHSTLVLLSSFDCDRTDRLLWISDLTLFSCEGWVRHGV